MWDLILGKTEMKKYITMFPTNLNAICCSCLIAMWY